MNPAKTSPNLPTLEDLRQLLRRTRAAMLAPVVGLPEAWLQAPNAVGPYSVAQLMAIRIEAENRALTLVQSMLHGHPVHYPLSREEYDRRAVLMRWGWAWDHLMRELYQQREETSWNLDDLAGEVLHRRFRVGDAWLSPYEVLAAIAREEQALGEALEAWRKGLDAQVETGEIADVPDGSAAGP
jgi:hypothetical protein